MRFCMRKAPRRPVRCPVTSSSLTVPIRSTSVLMPVHNRAHLLDRVLGALADTVSYPEVELLAVDDRSTDGSLDLLRRWETSGRLPVMRVLESPGAGAVVALNTALDAASGEFCV